MVVHIVWGVWCYECCLCVCVCASVCVCVCMMCVWVCLGVICVCCLTVFVLCVGLPFILNTSIPTSFGIILCGRISRCWSNKRKKLSTGGNLFFAQYRIINILVNSLTLFTFCVCVVFHLFWTQSTPFGIHGVHHQPGLVTQKEEGHAQNYFFISSPS